MIDRVVILGGHIQALGLARQVHTKKIEVVLVCEDSLSIARFSNAVSRTIIYHSHSDLLDIIDTLCLPQKSTLLFPTNDEAVEFLCANYDNYATRFSLGIPQPQIVTLFNNKRKAYQYVAEHNIPCPQCWYPDTMEEVTKLSVILPYPVVVKPAIMHSFHRIFGKKAFRCNNAEELLTIYNRIQTVDYPLDTILIQEFLSGGPKQLYSCGVMAVEGKPILSLQANRIRQNPMDFGNSTTFAITCYIQQIQTQSEQLLSLTNYFGMGEIEWMWDENDGQYKFLEINTRAWKWHTIINQLGGSFIGAMIDYFNQMSQQTLQNNDCVGWVERLTDWTIIVKELLKGKMSLSEIIKSYKIKKESAVWSLTDMLPAIMYILLSPILYFKRY